MSFTKTLYAHEQEVSLHNRDISFDPRFCYLLPYDLTVMLGFHSKVVKSEKVKIIIDKIISDFGLPKEHEAFFFLEFEAALGSPLAWEDVLRSNLTKGFKRYLKTGQEKHQLY